MPSLGGRVPQGALRACASEEKQGVSMPSLGGRVPQVILFADGKVWRDQFQCPLWADGSRRLPPRRIGSGGPGSFNALFGRTGPAGGARRSARTGRTAVSMPSLGGRVPQVPRVYGVSSLECACFNALFGRTGPAGSPEPTRGDASAGAFQCPLWADGSRRVARATRATRARPRAPTFQCPLWADGSRRVMSTRKG